MATLTLILGAPDPEMQAIEELGHQVGAEIRYALSARGVRVRADEAYQTVATAARLHMDRRSMDAPLPPGTVYAVECDGPAIPADAIRIDHHRPGDPGYGRPPAEFLPASSIGQVVWLLASQDRIPRDWEYAEIGTSYGEDHAELVGPRGRLRTLYHFGADDLCAVGAPVALGSPRVDICVYDEHTGSWWVHWGSGGCDVGSWDQAAKIPADLVLIAAADHCLAAAYRGECPGVDPDALMRWRVESRAAFQRRPVEAVLADVERARAALREAPVVSLAEGIHARDLRGPAIPELPEAAAREGECFLASLRERDGKTKVVCQSGTPSQIEAFMRWAPTNGLTGIYGDPARGFAGGYAEEG